MHEILILVVVLALIFDFINGFHDSANSIATSISTRALTPRVAILMAAVLNIVGALMSSTVAKTISQGLVKTIDGGEIVVVATLLSAIIWNLITWYYGIPSSSSHALIGGLVGASIAFQGSTDVVIWSGVIKKVIIPLVTSPLIGFFFAYITMSTIFEVLRPFSQRVINKYFSKLQILSAAFMSYSHGNNDAQKSMGIITMALIAQGYLPYGSDVPIWVMVFCAVAMGLGTSAGGMRIIKTMGVNIIKLQPVSGFTADISSAIVIETMTKFGAPVSTTHVISSSIMGVGAAKRTSSVRWALARSIVGAWVLTIPTTIIIGGAIGFIFKLVT